MPYHIEYAKSSRAKCKGPKKTCPVEDRKIQGGELRLGSEIEGEGYTGVAWRHWYDAEQSVNAIITTQQTITFCFRKCTTPKVLQNLAALENIEEDLIGFTELHDEDQERVKTALEEGHVSESEEPEEDEKKEEKTPAKPKATKRASKKTAGDDGKDTAEKPAKRGRTKKDEAVETKPEPKKRGRKAKSDQPAAEDAKDEASEKAEKPAAKKRKTKAAKAEE
ncbi:unnamed protein product [Umbelopsis sp. WA50703]